MKRILLTVLVLVFSLFSINTFAASPTDNWTGFYAGLQGSYFTGSSDWTFSNGATTDHSPDGGIGGLFFGYNYQFPSNFVVGIGTDIGAGSISGSNSCPNAAFECKSNTSWLGATRFRLGYAMNRFLPYLGIGIAYSEIKLTADQPTVEYKAKDTYIGWTPAIGFDLAITKNLLANFEYAYYDFGKENTILVNNVGATSPVDNKVTFHSFKIGIGWKF